MGQRMKSAGTPFNIHNLLYINNSVLVFQSLEDTKIAAHIIFNHFSKFGLKMHIRTEKNQIKERPCSSLPHRRKLKKDEPPIENILLNNDSNNIPFIKKIRYLGTLIIQQLNKDIEIQTRIKKAKSQMGDQ